MNSRLCLGDDLRLPTPFASAIDRSRPIEFRFEGRALGAFSGDTVASALAANGVSVLSRSFKYRRPRGLMSLSASDANSLVQVNGVPNVYAERHLLADGDDVRGQNYCGSLQYDLGAWAGAFARFLPVGFYYRAFFRPRGAWRLWEPFIRRRAGIGRIAADARHGDYDKAYLFADVAVVGGGAAGLSAAIGAGESGARVILIHGSPTLGGALAYARTDAAGKGALELARLRSRLTALPNVRVLTGAICEGLYADNWLAVVQGRRLYKLRAGRVILATGALEQPAVFAANDRPGILLGSAAQRLMRLYGVRPGKRAVVLTANDAGYCVALDLGEAGVEVAALVDLRDAPAKSEWFEAAAKLPFRLLSGCTIRKAHGTHRVSGVEIARLHGVDLGEAVDRVECDLVCMSVGYAPNLALAAQSGARIVYDQSTAMQRAVELDPTVAVVGSASQHFSLDHAVDAAAQAGRQVARREPVAATAPDSAAAGVTHPFPIYPHPKGKDFVDLDEDLTVRDLHQSIASGFGDLQLLKRYSTVGMGPSQGRHSAANTIRIAARAQGVRESEMGTTTARPPYSGVSFGVLAGRSFDPVRRTPMHHRHLEAGARMMVAGTWLRPAHYGSAEDAEAAIGSEVLAVRTRVGLIDVATLGKIELRGPDAAEFLDRMYVTSHRKQPVGRARYCLMSDISGVVTDDGVVCRLSDQHFLVTATTSGADAVVRSMFFWNAQWRLDVDIANVTAAYAAISMAGPRSRDVLAGLSDIDVSPSGFPYLAVRTGMVAGIRARLIRVGFVGELGYEIHLPAGCGEHVWDALLVEGKRHGIARVGVEAQRVLRLEKGHVIVGQDTDGLTHPLEIGFSPGTKPFFIGATAMAAQAQRGIRRKLVGFEVQDNSIVPKESHLVIENGEIAGRVTSCVRSPVLGKTIGLAYVRPHQTAPNTAFMIRADGGKLVRARVTPLPFYDPDADRLKA